jgi:hypothetical protein
MLIAWIKLWNRIGFGRFKTYNQLGDSFQTFCEKEADRITYYTRYMTYSQFMTLAKDLGFRPTFRYTQEIYVAKLRSLVRRDAKLKYSSHRNHFMDWLWAHFLKHVGPMTYFLDKRNTVRIKYATAHGQLG